MEGQFKSFKFDLISKDDYWIAINKLNARLVLLIYAQGLSLIIFRKKTTMNDTVNNYVPMIKTQLGWNDWELVSGAISETSSQDDDSV